MLHFLSFLDCVADVKNDENSNFNHAKNVLKENFLDEDLEQLVYMLRVLDDLRILFIKQDFNEVALLIESLCQKIFTLYEEKTIESNRD